MGKKLKNLKYFLLSFVLIISTFSSHQILSQESEVTGIEEIIVTARQQAESLQDVPVTVSVMSEMDLDRYNIINEK